MPLDNYKFTPELLLENEQRAARCDQAAIPGAQLRELIRLAKIGLAIEQANRAGSFSDEDDERQVKFTGPNDDD